MPGDDIVICKIKGLAAASSINRSTKNGYIVFICGSDQINKVSDNPPNDNVNEESDDESIDLSDGDNVTYFNDSKVAKLYTDKVYYPFIDKIRREFNGMPADADGIIPDVYTAVSGMDGCYGQLRMTTQEQVLKTEKKK